MQESSMAACVTGMGRAPNGRSGSRFLRPLPPRNAAEAVIAVAP